MRDAFAVGPSACVQLPGCGEWRGCKVPAQTLINLSESLRAPLIGAAFPPSSVLSSHVLILHLEL